MVDATGPSATGPSATGPAGTSLLQLRVVETSPLSPTMRRIRLSGEDLVGFSYVPGQDLMVSVPAEGQATFRRRYTIRRLTPRDPALALPVVDLDVVAHGDGPGARWVRRAGPGDVVTALGPRGKIPVDEGAPWHLFAGDESALPATFAMLEAVPSGAASIVRLEVGGPSEEQPPPGLSVGLRWVHRRGRSPGDPLPLVEAISSVPLPPGPGRAYLFGELKVVAALRRTLLDRGLEATQLSSKPYWRLGVANAAHGEPERD